MSNTVQDGWSLSNRYCKQAEARLLDEAKA